MYEKHKNSHGTSLLVIYQKLFLPSEISLYQISPLQSIAWKCFDIWGILKMAKICLTREQFFKLKLFNFANYNESSGS